jgi:hypothetical protein
MLLQFFLGAAVDKAFDFFDGELPGNWSWFRNNHWFLNDWDDFRFRNGLWDGLGDGLGDGLENDWDGLNDWLGHLDHSRLWLFLFFVEFSLLLVVLSVVFSVIALTRMVLSVGSVFSSFSLLVVSSWLSGLMLFSGVVSALVFSVLPATGSLLLSIALLLSITLLLSIALLLSITLLLSIALLLTIPLLRIALLCIALLSIPLLGILLMLVTLGIHVGALVCAVETDGLCVGVFVALLEGSELFLVEFGLNGLCFLGLLGEDVVAVFVVAAEVTPESAVVFGKVLAGKITVEKLQIELPEDVVGILEVVVGGAVDMGEVGEGGELGGQFADDFEADHLVLLRHLV